jgi:parallel beta-helix repeat protein
MGLTKVTYAMIDGSPASVLDFGASTTSTGIQNSAAIQAAVTSGAASIYIPAGVYQIASVINLTSANVSIFGEGTLQPIASFSDGSVLSIQDNDIEIAGISIDCSLIPTGTWVRGIWVSGPPAINNVIIDGVKVNNATFTGIQISSSTPNVIVHENIVVKNCIVKDSGWQGIEVGSSKNITIENNQVISSGWNALALWGACDIANVIGNYVTKENPPPIIYDGPGGYSGVEKGGLLYLSPNNKGINVIGNNLYDNQNADEDAIVVGEDGITEFDTVVISGNTVTLAGQFGIDAHSNFTVVGNTVNQAKVGIFIGRDLGGLLRNVVIANNNVKNCGYVAGAYGIQLTSNMGNANTMSEISITGNVVTDDRVVKLTDYGLGINLTDSTYTSITVSNNDFSKVGTKSIEVFGSPDSNNLFIYANRLKQSILIVTANNPKVYGFELIDFDPAAPLTLTNLVAGFLGQTINVTFLNANTTIDFSSNPNFYGNSGVDYTPAAFSTAIVIFHGDAWYWTFS